MAVAAPAAAALLALDIAETVLIQIVGQLVATTIGAVLAPEFEGLTVDAYGTIEFRGGSPPSPLSSAQAALAVVRGYYTQEQGAAEAKFTGYNKDRFQVMVDSTGQPLPLEALLEAWRRGIIKKSGLGAAETSLEQGIRESDLKNKWTPIIEALQFQVAPVGTIIEGWLRAQITAEQAYDLAYKRGVDKPTADLMYKSAGRPPSPGELAEMLHRGIIPETGEGGDTISVRQGYLETDLKNKWYEAWLKSLEYIPPPRITTALLREGAITEEQARTWFEWGGLSKATADIYVKSAHRQTTQTTRELTKAELVSLYVDQAIDAAELGKRLLARGYLQADVDSEIELADLKVSHALEQRAVNRVGTLYTGRRIDKQAALSTLDSLKLPATQRDRLLKIWDLERGDNIKHLTPPELGKAVLNGWYSVDEALNVLAAQGFGARDAWVLLSIELKAPASDAMPTDNLPPA